MMNDTYKPGDRVRLTVDGFDGNDEPMEAGATGTVVDITDELLPTLPPAIRESMIALAQTLFDLAVRWDGAPPDAEGHMFYMQYDDEVEPE